MAEDICAEVFGEAARWYAHPDATGVGVGWLIEVARRRLIDHWRKEERSDRRLRRLEADLSVRHLHAASTSYDAVFEALASLSPRQRAALTLRYLDGFSVAEVAEALDCPYRAAESLLARGRRSFVTAWEEHDGFR